MSGWLDLTQLGLAPNQKHQALLGAPKTVHCGLPQGLLEALTLVGQLLHPQVLEETEHFRRLRQQKVAKIV
jgi:hypothetical protein